MHKFERVYMRTLRHVYDTEKQLQSALPALEAAATDSRLGRAVSDIARQSRYQAERLERLFALLYLEPQADPSWVASALLREARDSSTGVHQGGPQGTAAALLALKRYEITLYEALLRWSEQCELVEAIGDLRRSIAEELVQASVLSELAFCEDSSEMLPVETEALALH